VGTPLTKAFRLHSMAALVGGHIARAPIFANLQTFAEYKSSSENDKQANCSYGSTSKEISHDD
jgi:hypothetical protein